MDFIETGARFNKNRTHRYALWRVWDTNAPKVMFIGLNPSTADENKEDPTLKRVIQFSKDWGFGGVFMCNLFSFITPYPEELQIDTGISENKRWLKYYSKKTTEIVCAWGAHKAAPNRAKMVYRFMRKATALQLNNDGSPRHPLYVKSDVKRVSFIPQISKE